MVAQVVRSAVLRVRGESALALEDDWPSAPTIKFLWRMASMARRGLVPGMLAKSRHGLLFIGRHVELNNLRHISFGANVILDDYVEIQGLSTGGVCLGNNVSLGRGCLVRPTGNYGGRVGQGLSMGDGSSMGPFGYIGCSGRVTIGCNVMMGPRVSIFAENHITRDVNRPIRDQGVYWDPVVIEDDVWLGSNSVVLPGVRVGQGAVVASGAVVTRDVEPFTVVGGVPARLLRRRIEG